MCVNRSIKLSFIHGNMWKFPFLLSTFSYQSHWIILFTISAVMSAVVYSCTCQSIIMVDYVSNDKIFMTIWHCLSFWRAASASWLQIMIDAKGTTNTFRLILLDMMKCFWQCWAFWRTTCASRLAEIKPVFHFPRPGLVIFLLDRFHLHRCVKLLSRMENNLDTAYIYMYRWWVLKGIIPVDTV